MSEKLLIINFSKIFCDFVIYFPYFYTIPKLFYTIKKYDVPNVHFIGYINIEDDSVNYPYFVDNVYNYYYIKNNTIYHMK